MHEFSGSRLVGLYKGENVSVRSYVRARCRLLELDCYLRLLPEQGLIVDVGCGYGVVANYLSLCLPHARIVGIDLNKKRIDAALKTIGSRDNIRFLAEDATRWEWPGCAGIAMTDFLHHVPPPEQEAVLRKAYDALQEEGVLLISEVDPTARPLYRYWASYLSDRVLYPFSKSYFRRPGDWESALAGLGFDVRIIKLRNPFFAGVLMVCGKSMTGASNESRVLQA